MYPAALQIGYGCKVNNEITVKDIFLDNHNLDRFKDIYKNKLRDVEIAEVEKMLSPTSHLKVQFLLVIF